MNGIVHPARLDVGVVGAGRVGAVLGAALARAGHRVTGIHAVSAPSRRRAAQLLPGVDVTSDIRRVVTGCELVVLAVPDDVLPGLVTGLAAAGVWQAGQIVVHTSGAHGVRVLDPALAAHVLPLALHPAMTFGGNIVDLENLLDCAFGVTCLPQLRPLAEALVIDMGGEPVWVAEEDRGAYHAALTHGANHLVTLIAQARDLLASAGVEDPAAVLGPLTRTALENSLAQGDAALTGPVVRGDVGTVRTHLRVLAERAPEACDTYAALARASALRALDCGRLSAVQAEPLLDALAHHVP